MRQTRRRSQLAAGDTTMADHITSESIGNYVERIREELNDLDLVPKAICFDDFKLLIDEAIRRIEAEKRLENEINKRRQARHEIEKIEAEQSAETVLQ
jgi:hypothetical protein